MGGTNPRIVNEEKSRRRFLVRRLPENVARNLIEESKDRIYEVDTGIQAIDSLKYEADVAKDTIIEMKEQIEKLRKEKVSKREIESVNMQIHILEGYIKKLGEKTLSAKDLELLNAKRKKLEARKKALADNVDYMKKRTGIEEEA